MCEEDNCLGTVISGLSSPSSHCPPSHSLTPLPSPLPANKRSVTALGNRPWISGSLFLHLERSQKILIPAVTVWPSLPFSVSNHRLSNTSVLGVGWGGGLAIPRWLTKQFISLFAWLSLRLTKDPQVPSLSVLRCALTHFPRSHN